MHRTATGQRPQLNQAHSSGWHWPRLVPIQEQHARTSPDKGSSAHSSKAQSVHEQTPSPAELIASTLIRNPPTEDADTGSIIPTTAPGAFPVLEADTESLERRHSSEAENSALPTDMDVPPGTHQVLPQSPASSVAGRNSSAGKSVIGSAEDRELGQDESRSPARTSSTVPTERRYSNPPEASSSASGMSETSPFQHTQSNGGNDTADQVNKSESHAAKRKYSEEAKSGVSTISGLDIHSAAIEDRRLSGSEVEKDIDEVPSEAEQGGRRLSEYEARKHVEEAPKEADQGNITRQGTPSKHKQAEVQSITEDDAQSTEEKASTGVVSDQKQTSAPSSMSPVTDRVSVPSDPIPYYATPKIMVHKPSASFQSDTSGPRTIDEMLARERGDLTFQEHLPARELPLRPAESSAMPQLTRLPTGAVIQKNLQVKKRSLYLRKARNLAARKTILKITLGRQLAIPTKQSLRQLANGENAIAEFPVASSTLP